MEALAVTGGLAGHLSLADQGSLLPMDMWILLLLGMLTEILTRWQSLSALSIVFLLVVLWLVLRRFSRPTHLVLGTAGVQPAWRCGQILVRGPLFAWGQLASISLSEADPGQKRWLNMSFVPGAADSLSARLYFGRRPTLSVSIGADAWKKLKAQVVRKVSEATGQVELTESIADDLPITPAYTQLWLYGLDKGA